jgi:hypothetical protein
MRTVYLNRGTIATLEILATDDGWFFATISASVSKQPKFLFRPTRSYEAMRQRIQTFIDEGYDPVFYPQSINQSKRFVRTLRVAAIPDTTFQRIGNTPPALTAAAANTAATEASTLGSYISVPLM